MKDKKRNSYSFQERNSQGSYAYIVMANMRDTPSDVLHHRENKENFNWNT